MGVCGSIDFYQTFGGRSSLKHRLQAVAGITGSTSAWIVVRSKLPFTEGEHERTPDDFHTWTIDEVCAMQRGIGTMRVELGGHHESWDLHERLAREIPDEIADGFYPSAPSVTLGWHLIDDLPLPDRGPDPTKRHLARFSLSLFGYSCPKNWDEYRRRIFETNAMRELEAQLVEAIGPVKRAISWSV